MYIYRRLGAWCCLSALLCVMLAGPGCSVATWRNDDVDETRYWTPDKGEVIQDKGHRRGGIALTLDDDKFQGRLREIMGAAAEAGFSPWSVGGPMAVIGGMGIPFALSLLRGGKWKKIAQGAIEIRNAYRRDAEASHDQARADRIEAEGLGRSRVDQRTLDKARAKLTT